MPYKKRSDQREAWRRHYYKHKARNRNRVRERIVMLKNILDQIRNTGCADCNIKYPPYVMDFHHIEKKSADIATIYRNGWAIDRFIAEVEKCIVLCSNCHRVRTHREHNLGLEHYPK